MCFSVLKIFALTSVKFHYSTLRSVKAVLFVVPTHNSVVRVPKLTLFTQMVKFKLSVELPWQRTTINSIKVTVV